MSEIINEISCDTLPGDILDTLLSAVDLSEFTATATFTDETFALKMTEIATEYVGVSRQTDIGQVGKFLALFGLDTKDGGSWVPFCAAGVSYSAAKAFCQLSGIAFTADNSVSVFQKVLPQIRSRFFLPSPSCGAIKANSVARGNWVSKDTKPQKGWLVLYNWVGGSAPEHVGLVIEAADELHTVEFNTSSTNNSDGGCVALRTRPYACVVGYVKLY